MFYKNFFETETVKDLLDHIWYDRSFNGYDFNLANIQENEESYRIEMLAPGVKIEDVSIQYENSHLTVSLKRKSLVSEGQYNLKERPDLSYSRSFRLTDRFNVEQIQAKLNNGVLEIVIPKAEEVKPRKIEVKVS